MEKKLLTWKTDMLSIGDQLVFARNVLCAMPTHFVTAMVLKKAILAKVNRIIFEFSLGRLQRRAGDTLAASGQSLGWMGTPLPSSRGSSTSASPNDGAGTVWCTRAADNIWGNPVTLRYSGVPSRNPIGGFPGRPGLLGRQDLLLFLEATVGDFLKISYSWTSPRRDWPNLPTALVDDIADRLLSHDVAEYIRLRAACKEWRRCTADPREGRNHLDPRFRPRRWIMLSNRTDGDGRRFLNLSTGASARVDLPELSRHHLEASAEGLLLLRDKASHAARLLNPLTRALTDLPPVTVDLGGAYAGRFYFSTVEGYILQVRLCPEPRVVPVVVDQPNTDYNMFCYLVPPDDDRRCGGRMLMVRYYLSLDHLSADERRIMKRRRKVMDVIRVEHHVKAQRWNLIQVFEVDVAGKRLVPVEDIGRHRAVFVGEVACFSLSARRFPCVAGNAVYMGHAVPAALPSACGFLDCISMKQYREKIPELNLVPLARPCTLQEYLVCCAGLLGGLND
ncbi:hypothetical protein VPH35_034765 [Triticum aestivum]|uniref:KIB1-4 beta-propeller domain-containing protein n=1 Tax=Aegilops tauschii TaxID=37682 RepID=R7W5K5_AEGTA